MDAGYQGGYGERNLQLKYRKSDEVKQRKGDLIYSLDKIYHAQVGKRHALSDYIFNHKALKGDFTKSAKYWKNTYQVS